MSTHFVLEHYFDEIPLSLFENHLNDPKLNRMLAQMSGIHNRKLIQKKKGPKGEKTWKFEAKAIRSPLQLNKHISGMIDKFVPDGMVSWFEMNRFVPSAHCMYWEIEFTQPSDRLKAHGQVQLQEEKGGTRRIIEGDLEVRIPFLSQIAETFIVTQLKQKSVLEYEIQKEFYQKIKQ